MRTSGSSASENENVHLETQTSLSQAPSDCAIKLDGFHHNDSSKGLTHKACLILHEFEATTADVSKNQSGEFASQIRPLQMTVHCQLLRKKGFTTLRYCKEKRE